MNILYLPNPDPRFENYNKFIEEYFPQFLNHPNPDLIMICGGDGALLKSVQMYSHLNKPFFGKAGGTVNFLMNDFENDYSFIKQLLAGEVKLKTQTFQKIDVKLEIKRNGTSELISPQPAINEVVLGGNLNGYHEFSVSTVDGALKNTSVLGSGVCVSTVLGSTAYNYNNWGDVLPLTSNHWGITSVVSKQRLKKTLPSQTTVIQVKETGANLNLYIDGEEIQENVSAGSNLLLLPGKQFELAFLSLRAFEAKRNALQN